MTADAICPFRTSSLTELLQMSLLLYNPRWLSILIRTYQILANDDALG
jgi:hypothetical protein